MASLLVWCLGVEKQVLDFLQEPLASCDPKIFSAEDFEKLMACEDLGERPKLILCGKDLPGMKAEECGQLLRALYQDLSILHIQSERPSYEKAIYLKNGFSEAYTLAIDAGILVSVLRENIAKAAQLKVYKAVKLIDLQAKDQLNFDTSIFLPANKKHLTLTRKGEELSEEKFAKLKKQSVQKIHVALEDMPQFYEYTAAKLRTLGNEEGLSFTERQEKMQTAVRSLLVGVLGDQTRESSIAEGRELMSACEGIVKQYVCQTPSGKMLDTVQKLVDDAAHAYSHAGNTSTFASLFSMALGIGKPEELAIAGLLHDLGMSVLPVDLQNADYDTLTPDKKKEFEKHVEEGLSQIRQRKLILSDGVLKAISQHHERFCGGGYPKGLHGEKVSQEAQILALADRFDEMLAVKEGKKRIAPREALELLKKKCMGEPTRLEFSPQIFNAVLRLFEEQVEERKESA